MKNQKQFIANGTIFRLNPFSKRAIEVEKEYHDLSEEGQFKFLEAIRKGQYKLYPKIKDKDFSIASIEADENGTPWFDVEKIN